jgi:hypothetical protein
MIENVAWPRVEAGTSAPEQVVRHWRINRQRGEVWIDAMERVAKNSRKPRRSGATIRDVGAP